ncbi:Polygalacturonase QRT2, partial [Cucurbita argyrosperma subsp. sororia]
MLTTRLEKMASSPVASSEIFNVDDYGAMGDGEDDSEAFKEAWKEACSSTNAIFLVPNDRTYHLKPITFSGPCNSPFAFKIEGTIKASPHISDYEKDRRHWIIFENLSEFTVEATQIILIQNCLIMTGDDCISIVSGSKNVRAKGITCGPGHGISIGSLGAGKSEAEVSNVVVDTAKFTGTSNGVRIKTWQGGKGYAENIIFQNIVMDNVTNPIIIDQNYCDQKEPCTQQAEAVQVSNVMYQNIRGTSGSEVAVKFDCSKSFPCQEILLQDIDLVHRDKADDKPTQAEASCKNARLKNRGRVSPQCPGRR